MESLPPVSPPFDAAVQDLLKKGIKDIRAARFEFDQAGRPWHNESKHHLLKALPELEEGEWWVPYGFDGQGYIAERCFPPWLSSEECGPLLQDWIEHRESEQETSGSFEDFVREELSALEAQDERGLSGADEALRMLQLALTILSRLCNRYPQEVNHIPIDERPLDLPEECWIALGYAYRAGQAAEHCATRARGVFEIAQKTKKIYDRQGKGRGPLKKTESALEPWEAKAMSCLRADDTYECILARLVEGEFAKRSKTGQKYRIKGERKWIKEGSLKARIRKLRTR